jgi:hypothetical protein
MSLRILLIGGTGAPKRSQFYYQPLLDVAKQYSESVDFEAIFMLGFGSMKSSASIIGNKYFGNPDDKFVVIGHSQGAILATLIAMEYPSSVLAVISLAGPFAGTTWTDPLNMPVRVFVELVSRATLGMLKLKPALLHLVVPVVPIISDLRAHSEVSEMILSYLGSQESGHETHAIIGSSDMLVFPRRSASPLGKMVTSYLATDARDFRSLKTILPNEIRHINSRVGHISIVSDEIVLRHIGDIISKYKAKLISQD